MRRVAALTVLALAVAACGSTAPPPTTSAGPTATTLPAGVEPVEVDLTDDELLADLGAPRPEGARWLRPIEGTELVGTTETVDPEELRLLDEAMRLLPPELGPLPRAIVRTPTPPAIGGRTDPSAVAVGPDIYLFDDTFERDGLPIGPLGLARILSHEIVHIAQFDTLEPTHVGEVLAFGGSVDLAESTLLEPFTSATGWEVVDEAWAAPPSTSTEYGGTNPVEDMAEAVSLVTSGLGDSVPQPQREWVEEWLGADADTLAAGMPWAPAGSEEVLSASPLYDEEAVAAIEGTLREYIVYSTPADGPDGATLAATTQERLRGRGLTGTIGAVDDERIARWSGRFDRPDGVVVWVELWDFRKAPGFTEGPDAPVLSYMLVWP
ncbi:MAG: hypothetical protein AB1Z57_02930 [Acidimicrobiia bacterium]